MHLLNCICTLPLESLVRITLKAIFGTVQLPLKTPPQKTCHGLLRDKQLVELANTVKLKLTAFISLAK